MIRSLTGTVFDTTLTSVVLEVGGVGYLIYPTTSGTAFKLETEASFWTYLVVRENALDLYGFASRDELQIFELLLGLPKIGPKSALQILVNADLTLLKQAVAEQDPSYLSKMSGIGKKTAETIVQGLKDPFEKHGIAIDITGEAVQISSWQHETIDALIQLGYPQKDVREVVVNLPAEITDTTTALPAALQKLSGA